MFDWGSLFGGIGELIGGFKAAEGYAASEDYYNEAARITKIKGGMQDLAIRRGIFQMTGAATAAQGASGLKMSGSIRDVIKSNTQQGYMTRAITAMNTNLEYKSYKAQAAQAKAQGEGSMWGGIFGGIGGLIGFFSDDRLKENVQLVGKRGDGLNIYRFNFIESDKVYEGVMASEVAVVYPKAVKMHKGYQVVDYAGLDLEFKRVA